MKSIVFVFLWVVSQFCYGGCSDILIGQRTWHSHPTYNENGRQHEYESNNYLLGCITPTNRLLAVFRNSYDDPTLMVGHVWRKTDFSPYITPYLALGAVVGYKDHLPRIGPFAPYGFVGIDIHDEYNKVGLMISTVGTVTSVGVRFSF